MQSSSQKILNDARAALQAHLQNACACKLPNSSSLALMGIIASKFTDVNDQMIRKASSA
jgi:hypothetical protein